MMACLSDYPHAWKEGPACAYGGAPALFQAHVPLPVPVVDVNIQSDVNSRSNTRTLMSAAFTRQYTRMQRRNEGELVQVTFVTTGNDILRIDQESVAKTIEENIVEVFATATARILATSEDDCAGVITGQAGVGDEISECEVKITAESIPLEENAVADIGAVMGNR